MDQLGTDFNATGSVMTKAEIEEQRRKRGECVTCGRKCYNRKLLRLIPITDHGRVLKGRCLKCNPLEEDAESAIPAEARPATDSDRARFNPTSSLGTTRNHSRRSVQSASSYGRDSYSTASGSGSNTGRPGLNRAAASERMAAQSLPGNTLRSTHSDDGINGVPHHRRNQLQNPSYRNASYRSSASTGSHLTSDDEVPRASRRREEEVSTASRSTSAENLLETMRENLDNRSGHHREAADLMDYYRASFRNTDRRSQRSMMSTGSAHSRTSVGRGSDGSAGSGGNRGSLDRGGAFPIGAPVRTGSGRPLATSARSLDSLSSFGDNDEAFMPGRRSMSSEHLREGIREEHSEEAEDWHQSFAHDDIAASDYSVDNLSASGSQGSNRALNRDVPAEEGIARLQEANGDYVDIIGVMRDFGKSANVQTIGLQELSNVQVTVSDCETIMNIGGLNVILDAMKAFPQDLDLQIAGFQAIVNLADLEASRVALVDEGALDLVKKVMIAFSSDPSAQARALEVVSHFTEEESGCEKVASADLINGVVMAMNQFTDNDDLLVQGCKALANLSSFSPDLKRKVMEKGGGGTVTLVMAIYSDEPLVQEHALKVMRHLSTNSTHCVTEIAHIGGLDAVINAMRIHRDSPEIQDLAASTIGNIASMADNRLLIGESGGIDVTVRAMWVHSANVSVQESCYRALIELAKEPVNCQNILRIGTLSAIVSTMQAHTDNSSVQELGCALLSELANSKESKMRIVDEEALDVVVLAMVLHADAKGVQTKGSGLFVRLAILENFKALQASNVGNLVEVAADKFPDECGELSAELKSLFEGFASQLIES